MQLHVEPGIKKDQINSVNAAWEDTRGKLPLGEKLLEKYLTPRETIANQTVHHKLVLMFLK